MKTRRELKQEAKDALRGNWGWAIALNFLPNLIIYVSIMIMSVFIGMIAYSIANPYTGEIPPIFALVLIPFVLFIYYAMIGISYSILSSYLDLIRGKKTELSLAATYAFREGRYWKFFINGLLTLIFVWLWTLLLYIPGIIKAYSYALAPLILKDDLDKGNPITATSAITKSRYLMDGHKFDLFVLHLSFIGWAILATLTFGIGYLWLIPYMFATYSAFYKDLAGDLDTLLEDDQDNVKNIETRPSVNSEQAPSKIDSAIED